MPQGLRSGAGYELPDRRLKKAACQLGPARAPPALGPGWAGPALPDVVHDLRGGAQPGEHAESLGLGDQPAIFARARVSRPRSTQMSRSHRGGDPGTAARSFSSDDSTQRAAGRLPAEGGPPAPCRTGGRSRAARAWGLPAATSLRIALRGPRWCGAPDHPAPLPRNSCSAAADASGTALARLSCISLSCVLRGRAGPREDGDQVEVAAARPTAHPQRGTVPPHRDQRRRAGARTKRSSKVLVASAPSYAQSAPPDGSASFLKRAPRRPGRAAP